MPTCLSTPPPINEILLKVVKVLVTSWLQSSSPEHNLSDTVHMTMPPSTVILESTHALF